MSRDVWICGDKWIMTKLTEHPVWIVVLHYPEANQRTAVEPHLLFIRYNLQQITRIVQILIRCPAHLHLA